MRICIATMTSPKRKALADITIPNMLRYCKKHGYGSFIINVEDDRWEYKKHEAFKDLFDMGWELIWYKDDDTLISQLSIPIESFIDDYYSFYITKDFNEFNGGSVIIRNTKAGRKFNDLVLESKDLFENEQNFYNSMPMLMFGIDIMKSIPHPSINSYRYDLYPECKDYVGREDLGDWVEGKSFVLHVPALPLEQRISILKNTPIIE